MSLTSMVRQFTTPTFTPTVAPAPTLDNGYKADGSLRFWDEANDGQLCMVSGDAWGQYSGRFLLKGSAEWKQAFAYYTNYMQSKGIATNKYADATLEYYPDGFPKQPLEGNYVSKAVYDRAMAKFVALQNEINSLAGQALQPENVGGASPNVVLDSLGNPVTAQEDQKAVDSAVKQQRQSIAFWIIAAVILLLLLTRKKK